MSNFPVLSSGAVTQYPLGVMTGQGSGVIRFLDGTDQRYRLQGQILRRWQIHLELLNETEMQAIEQFFSSQMGAYSTFIFPDPYSGAAVANCTFGADALLTNYEDINAGNTSFWVVETHV